MLADADKVGLGAGGDTSVASNRPADRSHDVLMGASGDRPGLQLPVATQGELDGLTFRGGVEALVDALPESFGQADSLVPREGQQPVLRGCEFP